MSLRAALALCAALALAGPPALAGTGNDVPSCYAAARIRPADGLGYSRLLYVLIDQTVGWSPAIESAIMDNLNRNLQPGTKFVIAEFSAYAQGRYLDVVHTGIIEAAMPAAQIADTPITATKLFDLCRADQLPYAAKLADGAAVSALTGSRSSLANSDIMSALAAIAPVMAAEPARQKILLLATDGLENSGVTSFYRHGQLRDIDPAQELSRAEAAGLVGDFGGARVYVIGGALPAAGSTEAYRSPQLLRHLASFWAAYFRQSNATLGAFGEPALLTPVAFGP